MTIGREVAWVDLWFNITFYDVLAENPKLHVVTLPSPIVSIKELGFSEPNSIRDVAIVHGFITYVELHSRIDDAHTVDGWMAAKWSMKITGSLAQKWHMDYKVVCSTISGPSTLQLDVHTPLHRLHSGLPSLSLQDVNIVYFLTKIDHRDSERGAWVLAVDFTNNNIK
ncbi:hypothetical protein D1007_10715 [Hordeum vulgare]|nr:hypothetical protein D1007_10715 [Hordeum vulgare]